MQCPNCGNQIPAEAKFCTFCGHSLEGGPQATGATAPRATAPAAGRAQRRWLLPALGGLVLVALVGVAGVFLLGGTLFSRLTGNERILYALQDNGPNDAINAIMIIEASGEELRELAYDRDGLFLPRGAYGEPTYLAPNGRWFAYFERTNDTWELVLADIEGGPPLLVDGEAVRSATFGTLGFSPDSRYFAYTTYSERTDDVDLHVVDQTGAEVLTLPDAIFGAFFSDSQRMLIVEAEEEGRIESLTWVSLDDGQPNRITHLTDDSGWLRPVVLPGDASVAFYSDNELLLTGVNGGAAQRLHEFDSPSSALFMTPDNKHLVVYDQYQGEGVGELRLFNLTDNRSNRVATDINLRSSQTRPGETAVDFSPNSELVAYLEGESGNLDLFVSDIDGRNRQRISNNNAWNTFAFSPNGRQIAFIEGSNSRRPGTLYIADVDGENRLRLDVNVWSFRFIDGGRRLVYSKVLDMERGDPESEIYRIDADGENQELILGVRNGIISLLHVLD